MNQSETLNELATALVAAQKEMPGIDKDATGHGYKYASLDNIMAKVRPVLAQHGLTVTQQPVGGDNGLIGLTTRLLHESGQWMEGTVYAPRVENKRINDVQGAGSTITYLRRYGIAALLGLADETDTDATRTEQTETPKNPRKSSDNGAQRPQWDPDANAATNFWSLAKKLKLSREEAEEVAEKEGGNLRHAFDRLVAEHVPPEEEVT